MNRSNEQKKEDVDVIIEDGNKHILDENIEFHEITYEGVGNIFEYNIHGIKWIQQAAAETMLGVRTKQFDRYCKSINPIVEKTRRKAKRYSYNFIKEKDIYRIADFYGKTIRTPLRNIPTLDDDTKVFSKGDVSQIGQSLVKKEAAELVKKYEERIHYLEGRTQNLEVSNNDLNSEVNKLVTEKADVTIKVIETEKDLEILKTKSEDKIDKHKSTLKWLGLFLGFVVLVAGAGGGGVFIKLQRKEEESKNIKLKYDKNLNRLHEAEKTYLKTKNQLDVTIEREKNKQKEIKNLKKEINDLEYSDLIKKTNFQLPLSIELGENYD